MERIYTDEQWEKDGILNVKIGQFVDKKVFNQLLNSVPPQTYGRGFFQPGEPYSHDWNTGQALYKTFQYVDSEKLYKYIGLRSAL